MRKWFRVVAAGLVVALSACGGGGSSGPPVIDFEDRPDDGIAPALAPPVVVADGVTISDVSPAGSLVDFTTADGFGLGSCDAEATSGNLMMGIDAAAGVMTVTFASPVRRVEVFASGLDTTGVAMEAFGAGGAPIGLIGSLVSGCPSLRGDDLLFVDAGSAVIESVEIRGDFLAIDDLTFD